MDDVRDVVLAELQEIMPQKTELEDERRKSQELEQRIRDLTVENQKSQMVAAEAERSSVVRSELQKLGVVKLDLAYKAIRDDIERADDGQLRARGGVELRDYLLRFVGENPELLPAGVAGGSGAGGGQRGRTESQVDLDKIRPGMSPEEMERVRQEIARVASQTLRGL